MIYDASFADIGRGSVFIDKFRKEGKKSIYFVIDTRYKRRTAVLR